MHTGAVLKNEGFKSLYLNLVFFLPIDGMFVQLNLNWTIFVSVGTKLSEDCCRYGIENAHDEILAKATSVYGDARKHVEKEQEDLNKMLLSEVGCLHNSLQIAVLVKLMA